MHRLLLLICVTSIICNMLLMPCTFLITATTAFDIDNVINSNNENVQSCIKETDYQMNQEHINTLPSSQPTFQTYKKRKETEDHGKEYEYLTCAYYALKFSTDDSVIDFEMTTNNDKFNDFDDVGLKVTFTDGTSHIFLMQLKHSLNKKNIIKSNLKAETGDFSILKYLKSFKGVKHLGNFSCILFTNRGAAFSRQSDCLKLKSEEITIKPCETIIAQHLLNTSKTDSSIFQFETAQSQNDSDEMEKFCKHFYLFVDQSTVTQIECAIREMLKNLLSCEVDFVPFMQHWWKGNFVLTKHDVIAKLGELALTPFIQELSEEIHDTFAERSKMLKNAIKKFEMTIVKSGKRFQFETSAQIDQVSKASFKYGLTTQGIKDVNELSREKKSKVLWYLNEAPLIIRCKDEEEERIIRSIRLLERIEKKKILLIGNKTKEDFPKWKIFENLFDLRNEEFYADIIKHFKVSFQGRGSIPLKQLIEPYSEMAKIIETGELISMLKEDLCLGGKKENLPEVYIPRTVSTIFLDIKKILYNCDSLTSLLIINCAENFKHILKFSNAEVMELHDYLQQIRSGENKNQKLIIISAECTQAEFDEICESKSNVHLLQIIDPDCCTLVLSKGDISPLESMYFQKPPIKEEEIHSIFNAPINIICSVPGMGKSTLMSYLSHCCPSNYWSVFISLLKYNSFLKEKPSFEEILSHFMKDENLLLNKVKLALRRNRKIYLFLDGLDEIDSDSIGFMSDFVKYVASTGIRVWVSSRKTIKNEIRKSLNLFSIDIQELSKEEQRRYIHMRLCQKPLKYDENEIEQITSSIFESVNITYNSENLLGVPLQLYIITEIFRSNKKNYELLNEEIFVLTKMYRIFFQGKKAHQDEKAEVKHSKALDDDYGYALRQYEIPGLRSCFNNDVVQKLVPKRSRELRESQQFLTKFKKEGNRVGIISQVIGENQAIFSHQTYAEYFACVWLKNNTEKIELIKSEFFSEKYQNLRLIFDIMLTETLPLHLATIYKNPDQVKRHLENYEETDEEGRSALHLACAYGTRFTGNIYNHLKESSAYKAIVKDLLKCDPSATDDLFDWNCLNYAIETQSLFPIDAIVKDGKAINLDALLERFDASDLAFFCSYVGYTNLLAALIKSDGSIINLKKGELKHSLLHAAVEGCTSREDNSSQDNIETIEMLTKHGLTNATNTEGFTALHVATLYKNFEVVKVLVENTANINAADAQGNTILHNAVENEKLNAEAIKWLIDKGANVNATNLREINILHVACGFGNSDTVKALVDAGANVEATTAEKETMLHFAAKNRQFGKNLIKLLTNREININAENINKRGALHIACEFGNYDTVKAIIEEGADANVTDQNKGTVLHLAVTNKMFNIDIVDLLIDEGVDINAKTRYGESVLHHACLCGDHETVKALVKRGADVNAVTRNKCTTLLYALRGENSRSAEFLVGKIDRLDILNKVNMRGESALLLALKFKFWNVVDKLLEKRVELDAATRRALIEDFAQILLHGQVGLVRLLLNNVTDVSKTSIPDQLPSEFPLRLAEEDGLLKSELLLQMAVHVHKFCRVRPYCTDSDVVSDLGTNFQNSNTNEKIITTSRSPRIIQRPPVLTLPSYLLFS